MIVAFCSYNSLSVCAAVSVLSKILFLITASTFALDNDSLVSKRPCIFEKSFPFTFVIESISCCDVTITQALPKHSFPSSSVTV